MIKKILILMCMGVFLFSCSSKEVDPTELAKAEAEVTYGEYEKAPAWVLNPSLEGGISALGIAKIGPAGMQFARTEAMANGRTELSRMISVKVQGLLKNFTQTTGVGDAAVVDKVTSDVVKQVTEQTLNGTKAVNTWISPLNNLHILVVIDTAMVKEQVKSAVPTSYKNDEALWQQFQAKNAHEELDKMVNNEIKDEAKGATPTKVETPAPAAAPATPAAQ